MLCLRCLAHGGTNTVPVLNSLLFLLSGAGIFFKNYHYLMKKKAFTQKYYQLPVHCEGNFLKKVIY
jgi:hypothetical protein